MFGSVDLKKKEKKLCNHVFIPSLIEKNLC